MIRTLCCFKYGRYKPCVCVNFWLVLLLLGDLLETLDSCENTLGEITTLLQDDQTKVVISKWLCTCAVT